MSFITRDVLDRYIGNKTVIKAEVFVKILEEQFDVIVPLKENKEIDIDSMSNKQRKEMTDEIFSNKEILKQLYESAKESDEDMIYTEEEFMKVIKEGLE